MIPAPIDFDRETTLGCAKSGRRGMGRACPSLAPLIERMFRYTWFLVTERRDAMIREEREYEVDALGAEARALQESRHRS